MTEPVFSGIGFPFEVGSSELPERVTDDTLIRASLIQLILTAKGERIMRADFGTGAHDFIFETNAEMLAATIRTTISLAIAKFETRVIVQRIDVVRDSSDGSYSDSVIITVNYVVKATQQPDEVSVAIGANQGTV